MIETVQQSSKQTFYEMLGGEQVVYELVEHFYDIVETDLIGEPVHVLHQQGMGINHLRQAQFEYLSGFLSSILSATAILLIVKSMSILK